MTAGVVAPLFFRIHVSPVLGYLLAGMALGPFGLGRLAGHGHWLDALVLTNVESIDRLAAFGVVVLMFTIGLELSFERLKSLRRLVFGLGLAQMVASAAADRRRGGLVRREAGLGADPRRGAVAVLDRDRGAGRSPRTSCRRADRPLQLRDPAAAGSRGRAAAVHGRDARGRQERRHRARPRVDGRARGRRGRRRDRARATGAASAVPIRSR